jgi:ribosome-binding factor A
MASTRQRKVQELLVREVSDILRREMRDPRVGFVTITDAEVTPDLRHAKVYYSVLGDAAARTETANALARAAGFVRGEFGRRAQLRFVPEIRFVYDASAERGARITRLLDAASQERRQDDEEAAEAPAPGRGANPESQ